jgi:predicted GNAT family acetyltransferase
MGQIIRFADAKREKRSGRFSTAEVYTTGRRKREKRSGRFSTREVYDGSAPKRSASGRLLREQEPLVRSGGGAVASDYAIRLAKGAIARISLTQESSAQARIDWVFVPPAFRGQGLAARILDQVVADADLAGVTLVLEARACAGLAQEALEAWYAGFGFAKTGLSETFGPVLERTPQRTIRRAA